MATSRDIIGAIVTFVILFYSTSLIKFLFWIVFAFLTRAIVINLIIIAVAVLVSYIYFQQKYKYWGKRNVPHAKPSFPMGNLGEARKDNFGVILKRYYDEGKNSRYYGYWQLHRPALMINDLELIRRVLIGDFMSFHDHGVYSNEKDDPLSANLFSLEGSAWRNLRVKLTPTFTSGKMKMMFPLLVDCSKILTEILLEPAKKGEVIEIKDIAGRFTTDVISSCAFGIEANSLKNPDSIIRKMGKKIIEPSWKTMLRIMTSFFAPDIARFFKINLTDKSVSDFFLNTTREIMDHREKDNVTRNDVVQLLIKLKNQGYIDDPDSAKVEDSGNKEKFTFEQAAAQAFVFFGAGFETSSTTMQFALYELSLNQDIQSRARKEINKVLGKHNGELTYEAIYEMEYLGRVIDETLRKYPPGSALMRICTKDYKVPDSELTIEKGTFVTIPVFGIHMDERYHPNPEKFDPERFTEQQKASRKNYTYMPFGEGPRVCIGQRFGLMQTRVGLATLLSSYKFDVCKDTPMPIHYDPRSFVISPEGGMNLKISLAED